MAHFELSVSVCMQYNCVYTTGRCKLGYMIKHAAVNSAKIYMVHRCKLGSVQNTSTAVNSVQKVPVHRCKIGVKQQVTPEEKNAPSGPTCQRLSASNLTSNTLGKVQQTPLRHTNRRSISFQFVFTMWKSSGQLLTRQLLYV